MQALNYFLQLILKIYEILDPPNLISKLLIIERSPSMEDIFMTGDEEKPEGGRLTKQDTKESLGKRYVGL